MGNIYVNLYNLYGWMDGWLGGWMDGWMEFMELMHLI